MMLVKDFIASDRMFGNWTQEKQWAGLDSNQRKLALMGLQPIPFSRSGTDPCRIGPFYMSPTGVARRIP